VNEQSKPKEGYNSSAGQSNALVQLFCDKGQSNHQVASNLLATTFVTYSPQVPSLKYI